MLAAIKIVETGTKDDVENFLVTEGAVKRDVDNNTLLHYACLAGNLDSVMALVNGGYYVNAPNVEGHTPICDAAIHGSPDVIRYLIQNGANKTMAQGVCKWHNTLRCSAICFLLVFWHTDHLMFIFLCLGADPNRRVRLTTPLHMAAKQQDLRLVRLLLSHGASPYPADADGLKPLDYSPKGTDVYQLLSSYMGRSLGWNCNLIPEGTRRPSLTNLDEDT
ncbi:unnamed protein product [Schistocephalus solidus]|uniref:ANK_REP_REGION domain-containing protein n=1 Tax=Schistocephalus solidus TaxID=70667 RepID=A0A183S7I5_SCHSO|nr:unnamed protein product [Schistocephalus solidus]